MENTPGSSEAGSSSEVPAALLQAKTKGNEHFKKQELEAAITCYTCAIELVASTEAEAGLAEQVAASYANRAACFAKLGKHRKVEEDSTAALALQPKYVKALLRRAIAREAMGKPQEASEDAKLAASLDEGNKEAAVLFKRLEKAANEELERKKAEMMGNLKDLGNNILGRFGMSLDNFKAEQDPNTGSYNIQFRQ